MTKKNELSENEILYAIDNKQFSNDILNSAKTVIIVMTQDWCPQWISMSKWIYNFANDECKVYEIIYNNKHFQNTFMALKENIFQNDLIPYVRIYKEGQFFKDCNYRSEAMFKDFLT